MDLADTIEPISWEDAAALFQNLYRPSIVSDSAKLGIDKYERLVLINTGLWTYTWNGYEWVWRYE